MNDRSRPAKAAPDDDDQVDCTAEPLRSVPTGTAVALLSSGEFLVIPGLARYELGDGDLVLTSQAGQIRTIPAGDWLAIGTMQHTDGLTWVALDDMAGVVA